MAADASYGYYYAFLNDTQKQCYEALYRHIRNFETEFDLDPVSAGDYLIANRAMLNDHPELWWADTPARYSFNLKRQVIHHQFLQLKGNERELTERMAAEVATVTANAKTLKNDWQRALYFHDYIVLKTKFNTGRDTDGYGDQNISSVFIGENSVCAGYSRAFQLLCRSVGMECVYVTGPAVKNNKKISHAWNLVSIGGQWTWVDCTWDDLQLGGGTESAEHDYFCLNDAWISREHPIPSVLETGDAKAKLAISFPKVTSLDMEYYHVNGCYFDKYNEAAVNACLNTQAPSGKIRLRFANASELGKAVKGVVYGRKLTENKNLRITKDDIMGVLRIDQI